MLGLIPRRTFYVCTFIEELDTLERYSDMVEQFLKKELSRLAESFVSQREAEGITDPDNTSSLHDHYVDEAAELSTRLPRVLRYSTFVMRYVELEHFLVSECSNRYAAQ